MPQSVKASLCVLALFGLLGESGKALAEQDDLLVRIAEVEVDAQYLEEYTAALMEEAEASIRLESGVISIFPMYQKGTPNQIRILEIYESRNAYDLHLESPHFKKYKSTTLKMVKSLKLVDMRALDEKLMAQVFAKVRDRQ